MWACQWIGSGVDGIDSTLLDTWTRAAESNGNIWQCPAIVKCWEEIIAKPRGLRSNILYATTREGHEVIYPLYSLPCRQWGIRYVLVEPVGSVHQCDYQDPLFFGTPLDRRGKERFWEAFQKALRAEFGSKVQFVAYRMTADSITESAPTVVRHTVTSYISLCGVASLDQFLRTRGKKLREHITRGIRALRNEGCHGVTRIPTPGVTEAMNQFCDTYERQWGRDCRAHALQDPQMKTYWLALAEVAAQCGKLHLSCIRTEQDIWHWHFGLEHRRRLLWYKPTYNLAYASRSPGSLHLALLIRDSIERGTENIEGIDLGCGSEPYKGRWTNVSRPLFRTSIEGGVAIRMLNEGWTLLQLIRSRASRIVRESMANACGKGSTQLPLSPKW